MARTRCYRDGSLVAEGFPVTDVSDYLADPANTVWFDLCSPDSAELESIREELGLHQLAVEDALQPGQRPKLDHYPEHLFLVAYTTGIDPTTARLRSAEVTAFITEHAMVTVRPDESFDIDQVVRRWDEDASLASGGVAFLLHGLIDYVVDSHYDTVQQLDNVVDALEDQLFNERIKDTVVQRQTFDVRKDLVAMRRLVLPMREVVNSLLRRDLGIVPPTLTPYFQDVYDHVLRVTEWTDSLRDLLANILETRLTVRSNRLNVITKQVTSWAAIIAVPTAVTGFYGQNVPYPGFGHTAGFIVSSAIILLGSSTLYVIFKRKDWL
jgi:magnesium transporter